VRKDGGSSESDIVSVAIKQLTPKIRERLEKLFTEGMLKENDLDLRSVTVFASLNEGLQDRVMTHMENERIYVANARSKSGFLIATCDKAKTGCLDARGLGAIDPWRSALVAMATPKQKQVELEPEREWIDKKGSEPVKLHINVAAAPEVGQPRVTVEVPLTESSEAVKRKLSSMGVDSIKVNLMKLYTESVGFLKDRFTLAYYNLADGAELELQKRVRGGQVLRKDHAVPLKRPKTHEKAAAAAAEAAAAAAKPAAGLPGLPLPGLAASLPSLPGLPKLPGLTPPAAGAAALPGLPKLPGMPGLPGGAGLPGLAAPKMPGDAAGLPKMGGMPGLPGGAGMPGLAAPKMPDFGACGGMPKLGMSGMPGMAAPKMGGAPCGMPKMGGMGMPGGMPGGPCGGMPGGPCGGMPGGPCGGMMGAPKGGAPGMKGGFGFGGPCGGMGKGMPPGLSGSTPKGAPMMGGPCMGGGKGGMF